MDYFKFIIWIMLVYNIGISQSIKFVVTPKNLTVNIGDTIYVECTTDEIPLYYTWEYKQIKKSAGLISTILGFCYSGKPCVINNWHSQIEINSQSRLIIKKVTEMNSGRYVCEISSIDGFEQITSSAEITVKTPPTSMTIHFNRSKNMFQENEYIAIQCTANGGIPSPKIYLSIVKNNQISKLKVISVNPQQSESVEVSATFLWRPNFMQHHGFVMCMAINEVGFLTKNSTLLNIKYEPKIKNFSPSIIKSMLNQTIDITCDVTANPPAIVQWIIMNGIQRIDSSDLVTRVTSEMAGTLTCKAKNSSGSRSKSIKLVVLRDPIISLQSTYKITENSDTSIICHVDSEPQPDFIRWYKLHNKTNHSSVLISNDAKLNFIQIDRISSGNYSCVTQNTQVPTVGKKRIVTKEKIMHLIVTYKPGEPRVLSEQTISIKKGDPFNLKCFFNDKNPGEPLPTLEWIDVVSKNIVSESNMFQVKNSESKHNGHFQCVAKNQIGSTHSSSIVTIIVHESPSLISHKSNNKIYLSYSALPQSVEFTCSFRGKPLYDSKWRYGNDIISPLSEDFKIDVFRNHTTDRANLIFSKLTINLYSTRYFHHTSSLLPPNGKYNCEASNKLGMSSIDYFLIIKYPPFIRLQDYQRKIAASVKQKFLNLHCNVESIPTVYISWFKTSLPLPLKNKKYSITTKDISKYNPSTDLFSPNVIRSDLIIHHLEYDDFTNYSCVSINEQGSKKITFEVVFKSEPDPPNDLKVKNLKWESVTISWTPGFNGGLEQNFEIQVISEHSGTQNLPFYSKKSENTLTITGLYPSTHYEIKIFAINSIGRSSSSPTVKCVTERIHKFDKIRAEILPDQPKISVVIQESDLCANLEYTRDNGRQWFSIHHCVRFNASYINKTVLLDINRITSMLDLQSGLIHLRLTFCLLSRPDVCSSPRVLENPRNENSATQTVILVIAAICFLLIAILITLFIICCIRFRYHCIFCNRYSCCFSRHNFKSNDFDLYNNRKSFGGKSIPNSRMNFENHSDHLDIKNNSTDNYCSNQLGTFDPLVSNSNCTPHSSSELYSSFFCPHREFRSQIPILYEGSSFLQPTVLSWSQKTSPLSCEASSSHSHSSTGSSSRNLSQNQIHYVKKHDLMSNNNILKSYIQLEVFYFKENSTRSNRNTSEAFQITNCHRELFSSEPTIIKKPYKKENRESIRKSFYRLSTDKIKLPDVMSEAIHFVKPPYDERIIEANV